MSVILEAAQRYHARGWALVSMTSGSKGPKTLEWEKIRYTPEMLPYAFNDRKNVGVLVGTPSGGLVDTDLDDEYARDLAAKFLPPTELRHGRESNPGSHWWYRCPLTVAHRFRDPTDASMLVEIRTSDGTKAEQTVLPPSLHPDDEIYEWDEEGDPARVESEALLRAVGKLAAAALLARHFPAKNQGRHNFCMALGAVLLRGGWDVDEAHDFIYAVAEAGDSDDPATRADTVTYTKIKLEAGEKVTGYPTLASYFGDQLKADKIITAVREWLGLKDDHADDEPEGFLTESGLAEAFALENAGKLIYVHESGWYTWNGKRWQRDPGAATVTLAVDTAIKQMVRKAQKELSAPVLEILAMRKGNARDARLAELAPGVAERAEYLDKRIKVGMQMQTSAHLTAIVKLMGAWPAVKRETSQLDANPWLFNVSNGTLDLKTGQLKPHDPGDCITKISTVAYNPHATCPTFEKFLAEVQPDPEVREFVQVSHGYSLTGSVREQCMFIAQGTGSNGKSVLDSVRRVIWGDYAMTADASTFMARNTDGIRNDIARLAGARLVLAPETESGRHIAEGLIKALTGGEDKITARFLWKESFEHKPTYKIWLSTNHRPKIKGTDHGIWRRLRLIPFPIVIPDDKQDLLLADKLANEASGILAWCVRGCLKWQKERLKTPATLKEAVDVYRQALDPISEWLESECQVLATAKTSTARLYESYTAFCNRTGTNPVLKDEFTDHLPHKGFVSMKVDDYVDDLTQPWVDGKPVKKRLRVRGWQGLALLALRSASIARIG